jgi:ankyrin repeat protein
MDACHRLRYKTPMSWGFIVAVAGACVVGFVGFVLRQLRSPHVMARMGNVDSLREALDATPALVHAKDRGGETPLHHAASHGQLAPLQLLLERGAAVDEKAYGGGTALMLAASQGQVEVLAALLRAGAALDLADDRGVTALHYAACFGHSDVAAMLKQHGARLDVKEEAGRTPLDVARENGKDAVVAQLG